MFLSFVLNLGRLQTLSLDYFPNQNQFPNSFIVLNHWVANPNRGLAPSTYQRSICLPGKCIFHCEEVKFLGYILGPQGVQINKSKVQTIQE